MPDHVRTREERKADVLRRLEHDRDVWVATADADATPYLVPVSLCWHNGEILLATGVDRPLARNVGAAGKARLGMGDGRDVVLITAHASAVDWQEADPAMTQAFVERVGWGSWSRGGSLGVAAADPHSDPRVEEPV